VNAGTIWSYVVTVVGLLGFILAGRKVWWAWYVNLGCQVLWFIFGLVTAQYGFIISALVYTVVFTQNAIKWTKERKGYKKGLERRKGLDVHSILVQLDEGYLTVDQARALVTENHLNKITPRKPWVASEAEAQEAYLKGIPPIQDTHLIVKNTRKH
jgi:hypothetical protein